MDIAWPSTLKNVRVSVSNKNNYIHIYIILFFLPMRSEEREENRTELAPVSQLCPAPPHTYTYKLYVHVGNTYYLLDHGLL